MNKTIADHITKNLGITLPPAAPQKRFENYDQLIPEFNDSGYAGGKKALKYNI
jgi:hypothetical protein